MRIPTWRLALTGGAVIVLALAGLGLAMAAGPTDDGAATGDPAASAGAETLERERRAERQRLAEQQRLAERTGDGQRAERARPFHRPWPGGRLVALGRHLVHAEVTVVDREGQIVEHHVDHGTIQSIGADSLAITEADGSTVTIATDDATIVRLGRAQGSLADLAAGDEVFVHSRVEDGVVVARHILRLPVRPDADG